MEPARRPAVAPPRTRHDRVTGRNARPRWARGAIRMPRRARIRRPGRRLQSRTQTCSHRGRRSRRQGLHRPSASSPRQRPRRESKWPRPGLASTIARGWRSLRRIEGLRGGRSFLGPTARARPATAETPPPRAALPAASRRSPSSTPQPPTAPSTQRTRFQGPSGRGHGRGRRKAPESMSSRGLPGRQRDALRLPRNFRQPTNRITGRTRRANPPARLTSISQLTESPK